MKQLQALLLAASPVALLALLSLRPTSAREELSVSLAEGQVLHYSFEQTMRFELTGTTGSFTQEGEVHEMPENDGEMSIDMVEKIVFTDEIVGVADDRIGKLRRTFDELSRTETMEYSSEEDSGSHDQDSASELEGKTVVFDWNADDDEYDVSYSDEGDEELLADLELDLAFAAFLPGRAVSEGDVWDAPISAMRHLLTPSGDVHLVSDDEEDDESTIGDQLEENLEGEISCRFAEVREEEGQRLAVIEITATVKSHASEETEFEVESASGTATQAVEYAFDVKGELLWSLAAGRALSLQLEGDFELSSESGQEMPDANIAFEQHQDFEGTALFQAVIE